ncbi:alginate lyase 2 [Lophiotrema nucula]|uniref:Alginate lyase 2 n=1 Tax=Lophiotrema nucula TaxID=690887 RepID=A0A6A5YWB8_9PLEO|nr:alginate lyase 2 [Lophiotrema nucula]
MHLPIYQTLFVATLSFPSGLVAAVPSGSRLSPKCHPGGNFDLSNWNLETSIDNGTGRPLIISAAKLGAGKDGCKNGWHDEGPEHEWFYTDPKDGAMVINAPGYSDEHPCIRTSGSVHCRTEFHEVSPSSWPPNATTNHLHVKLVGLKGSNVVIGQIFQAGTGANKPYAELYYHDSGSVIMGVATCPGGSNDGCNQDMQTIGTAPLGEPFTYDIRFEKNVLKAGLNGKMKTVKTYFMTPGAWFKFGNYNQGTDDASLHIFEMMVQH